MSALTTAEMQRITVAGTISKLHDTLAAVGRLKCVHLVDSEVEEDGFTLGAPHSDADAIAGQLARARAAVSRISPDTNQSAIQIAAVRKELDGDFSNKVDAVLDKANELDEANSEIERLANELAVLELLVPLGLELELYSGYDSLVVNVGTCSGDSFGLSQDTALIFKAGKTVAAFCTEEDSSKVLEALNNNGFNSLSVPEAEGPPSKAVEEIRNKLTELNGTATAAQSALDKQSESFGRMLLGAVEELERQFEVLQAPVRLCTSDHAFVLDGWVKSSDRDRARKTLSKHATMVEFEDYVPSHGHHHGHEEEEDAQPPIAFANPEAARPYELLTDLVGRPRYGRIDPTVFMMFTYPLFFGLMLGDMAYGMGTILLGLWVKKKFGESEQGSLAARLLIYIGISCLFFGFLYAEILGFEIDATGDHAPPSWIAWMTVFYEWAHHPHATLPFGIHLAFPFHRVGGNMSDLILISIYLGIAHLMIGYLIGMRDVTKEHGLAAGFFEKGSWIMVLLGGSAAIYGFMAGKGHSDSGHLDFLTLMVNAGLVTAAVGVVAVCWGLVKYEGFGASGWMIGPLETISLLSNTLSYIRLFAIGVVGVKIAEAGNMLGYHNLVHSIELVLEGEGVILNLLLAIGALLLWIFVQIFAWVLGVFSPNIHTARLHFVEWMGKFHEGSGEPFAPLGGANRYSKEGV